MTDPENMYLVKFPFGLRELRRYDRRDGSWASLASAHSREELDMKLALLGFEVDWSSRAKGYSIYPVGRIRT